MVNTVNIEIVLDKMPKRIIELITKKVADKQKLHEGWETRQQKAKCIN